jgi:alkyl sulfatase BDS1-like metallo-beta-lactamase superfamily hydrolase
MCRFRVALVVCVLTAGVVWGQADQPTSGTAEAAARGPSMEQDRKTWEGEGGRIIPVAQQIYVATGFALGNATMVSTHDGLVIIDTTTKRETAEAALAEFRKITEAPIKTVVYTHAHHDHSGGGKVFAGPGVRVIAHELWRVKWERDNGWLQPRIMRARALQGGVPVPRGFLVQGIFGGPAEPTVTFDESYTFTQGDVEFQLSHAPSETFDHLLVWVPQWRVALTGDAFYRSFPNLASPMIPCRDVRAWIASLDRIIGLEPEIVVPSHGEPLVGAAMIQEVLGNYRAAIAHVYEETLRGINQWRTVDEIAHSVELPPALAELPYLRERYGTVQGSVRGIYQCNTGWLDDNPTHANPAPPGARSAELVRLGGGADRVLARARELHEGGEHQLAMELVDVVLDVEPDRGEAHLLKAACCDALVGTSTSLNWRGFYRAGAALERHAAGEPLPDTGYELVPVER